MPRLSSLHRLCPSLFRLLPVALTLVALMLATLSPAGAAPVEKRPAPEVFKAAATLLDGVETRVSDAEAGKVKVDDLVFQDLRQQILQRVQAFTPLLDGLTVERQRLASELDALGPAPEDKTSEAKNVADLRQSLAAQIATVDAELKQAQVLKVRAQTLAQRISSLLRLQFAAQLFSRNPLPFHPGTWAQAAQELDEQGTRLGSMIANAKAVDWTNPETRTTARNLALTVVIGLLLVWPVRRWLNRRLLPSWNDGTSLGSSERVAVAVRRGLIRIIPFALFLGMANAVIFSAAILDASNAEVVAVLSMALLGFLVNSSLVWAAFSPTKPGWRLVPLSDRTARATSHLITAMLMVAILDAVASAALTLYDVSVETASLVAFAMTLALMLPLLPLTGVRLWHDDPASLAAEKSRWARWPVRLLAVVAVVVGSIGYVGFGHYLATNLFQTLVTAAVAMVLYVVLRELLHTALRHSGVFSILRDGEPTDEEHARSDAMIRFWANVVIGFAVSIPATIVLLLIWGVGQEALEGAWRQFVEGVTIGGITLSVVSLFSALVVFAGLLFATRLVKNILETRVLPMTRLDPGVQHSFLTSIGYIGTIIAVLGAAAALGIGLSNLAIVAGALSVGIGFGLQNIVNNFVSGLILLFERPIKVGDRVVAGGSEGYVRRIKVRATEIETFDRATVIIPNSALITASVTNMFLNNRFGRGVISIGVGYESDPEQVREILLDCARAHPRVIEVPPPTAFLMNFGDNALEFSLRFQIDDVEFATGTASEIRIAILHRLRAAGISIPYPQREVRVIADPGIDPDTALAAALPKAD